MNARCRHQPRPDIAAEFLRNEQRPPENRRDACGSARASESAARAERRCCAPSRDQPGGEPSRGRPRRRPRPRGSARVGPSRPPPISTVPGPTTSAPPSRRPSRTTHRRASPREGTRNTRGARIAIPHPRNPRPTPSPRRFAPSRRRGRRLPTHAPARPTGGTKPRGRPRAWATLDPPRTNSPRSTAEAPYRDPTIDTVNLPSVSRWDRCSSSGSAARSGSHCRRRRGVALRRSRRATGVERNRARDDTDDDVTRRESAQARFVPGAIRSRRDDRTYAAMLAWSFYAGVVQIRKYKMRPAP